MSQLRSVGGPGASHSGTNGEESNRGVGLGLRAILFLISNLENLSWFGTQRVLEQDSTRLKKQNWNTDGA